MTCGRRSSAGGVQVGRVGGTCSPERMSLTSWPPSAVVNQTNGMPRRSAYRICLPNFCGAGGDLARDAAGAQRVGDRVAVGAGLLVDERDEHGARAPCRLPASSAVGSAAARASGRRRARCRRRGTSSGRRTRARRTGRRRRSNPATRSRHADLEDRAGVVVEAAGDRQVGLDLRPGRCARRRSRRSRAASSASPSSSSSCSTPSARTCSTNDVSVVRIVASARHCVGLLVGQRRRR